MPNIPNWFMPFTNDGTNASGSNWGPAGGATPDLNFGVPQVNAATPPGPVVPNPNFNVSGSSAYTMPGMKTGMTPDQLNFAKGQMAAAPNSTLANANMAIQGIGVLGNIGLGAWGLYNAQQAFDFQKKMATANFGNSVKDYNLAMEDRIKARASFEGNKDQSAIQADIDRRKLSGV